MWATPRNRPATIVIDADDRHGEHVCASIQSFVGEARPCVFRRASDAVRYIEDSVDGVDFVFVDTALPDRGTHAVIDAVFRLRSSPLVIAMGCGNESTTDVFALAKVGVHAYLT